MSEKTRFRDPSNLTGEQIGRYHLQRKIGSGAVATVYQAYDHVDGRTVALKILRPTADANTISRFRREALTAGGLKHPNIVRIYQVGTAQQGDIGYIAMELVEGQNLGDWMAAVGRLHPEESCSLLEPIALALAHAHRSGIVHRDVKPSNILLQPASPGEASSVQLESVDHPIIPLLTDFGVARSLDAPELTSVGRTVGTPAYMAPEQASGSRTIDGRADIYSLGMVLYRAVVGHLPFSGTTTQMLHAHVYAPLTIDDELLRQIPPIVVDIMRCSLAKSPDDRYPDADAMASELALAAGRRRVEQVVGLGQPSDSTATLTLSAMPAAMGPVPHSASVLIPAAATAPGNPAPNETAIDVGLPSASLSPSPWSSSASRTRLQRLERFNWIGYGLALLALLALVIGVTLAAFGLPARLNSTASDGEAPVSASRTIASQSGDGPKALAVAASPASPTPIPTLNMPSARTSTLFSATPLPTQTARPSPEPTATLAPTATPLPEPSPTPTAAPTLTKNETIFSCSNVVDPFFSTHIAGISEEYAGGFRCPNGGAARTAGQLLRFEYGLMINLENSPSIYVLYFSNNEWERAVSTWQEGDPAKTGEFEAPAPPLFQPEGPFGQLWADPQRQISLGFATVAAPVNFAAVEQTFSGGALVGDEENGVVWTFLRDNLRL